MCKNESSSLLLVKATKMYLIELLFITERWEDYYHSLFEYFVKLKTVLDDFKTSITTLNKIPITNLESLDLRRELFCLINRIENGLAIFSQYRYFVSQYIDQLHDNLSQIEKYNIKFHGGSATRRRESFKEKNKNIKSEDLLFKECIKILGDIRKSSQSLWLSA